MVPAQGENHAPPTGSALETNNDCQVKFELMHMRAVAAPIPDAAPEMRTTLPASLIAVLSCFATKQSYCLTS
jgi:hypothetical protein